MVPLASLTQKGWVRVIGTGLLMAALVALAPLGVAQPAKLDVLHIGTSGTLTSSQEGTKEKGALETLQKFIKEETGLSNDISRQKDWQELADKMAKGQLQIGVFQGYEFAWAQEKHAELKPLALAVNLYRYPSAYVVTRRDDAAKDFAGLKGQSFCLPDTGQAFLRLFAERECQAQGKDLKSFFAKVSTQQSVEDALDDVVDGNVQAVVVDRAALEAFKQRKPGRFDKLKEVAKSKPFPPVLIAYYGKVLDEATLKQFKDGLVGAGKSEKGKTMLTMFRLTAFDAVPADFQQLLTSTRKAYPPEAPAK